MRVVSVVVPMQGRRWPLALLSSLRREGSDVTPFEVVVVASRESVREAVRAAVGDEADHNTFYTKAAATSALRRALGSESRGLHVRVVQVAPERYRAHSTTTGHANGRNADELMPSWWHPLASLMAAGLVASDPSAPYVLFLSPTHIPLVLPTKAMPDNDARLASLDGTPPFLIDALTSEMEAAPSLGAVGCTVAVATFEATTAQPSFEVFERGLHAVASFSNATTTTPSLPEPRLRHASAMRRMASATPLRLPRLQQLLQGAHGLSPRCLMTRRVLAAEYFADSARCASIGSATTAPAETMEGNMVLRHAAIVVAIARALAHVADVASSLPPNATLESDPRVVASNAAADVLGRMPSALHDEARALCVGATNTTTLTNEAVAQSLNATMAALSGALRARIGGRASEDEVGWDFALWVRKQRGQRVAASPATVLLQPEESDPSARHYLEETAHRVRLFTPVVPLSDVFRVKWGETLVAFAANVSGGYEDAALVSCRVWPVSDPNGLLPKRSPPHGAGSVLDASAVAPLTNTPDFAIVTAHVIGRDDDPGSASVRWFSRYSLLNKRAYAARWGLDLIVETEAHFPLEVKPGVSPSDVRSPKWAKISALRKWLPRYRYVLWMDMDAYFMNFDVPLHSLLDSDRDLVISRDWNNLNNGVFLLKNSPWSRGFLDAMWVVPAEEWAPFQDQGALIYLLDPKRCSTAKMNLRHTRVVPQRWLNSYPMEGGFAHRRRGSMYRDGDFIAHLPACMFLERCRETASVFLLASLMMNRVSLPVSSGSVVRDAQALAALRVSTSNDVAARPPDHSFRCRRGDCRVYPPELSASRAPVSTPSPPPEVVTVTSPRRKRLRVPSETFAFH